MTTALLKILSFSEPEPTNTIRVLLYLRIAVAILAVLSCLGWDFVIAPLQAWLFVVLVGAVVVMWSLLVLSSPELMSGRWSETRELAFDLFWISLLVYATGGASNPFIYYLLVIIALAALLLPSRAAWAICFLSWLVYTLLLLLNVSAHFQHLTSAYRNHLVGMWLNYVISSMVVCFFVSNLMSAIRRQQQQIQTIREQNLKSEQLIGIATVAASTVHNLATPLSTLRLIVDDLRPDDLAGTESKEDLELMRQQITRCQVTIHQLSEMAQQSGQLVDRAVEEVIDELREHYSLHNPERLLQFRVRGASERRLNSNSLFKFALVNLINNALESSASAVDIMFDVGAKSLTITIENTTHNAAEDDLEGWGAATESSKDYGLGIGSLLANSTIEQLGGTVTLTQCQKAEGRGARVFVEIAMPLL